MRSNTFLIFNSFSGTWLRFQKPVALIKTSTQTQVSACLKEIQARTRADRLYAAGFVSYEAAPAFDPAFKVHTPSRLPLLYFGLFSQAETCAAEKLTGSYRAGVRPVLTPDWSASHYNSKISAVKKFLYDGYSYQVNLTFPCRSKSPANAFALFKSLYGCQPTAYSAYLNIPSYEILSVSPELFFLKTGKSITLKPMKGTIGRGRTAEEDRILADTLYHSLKDRAENLMIVDMIRNDVGRIAEPGSVQVPRLFEIEKYPSLFQMTSTVTAQTHTDIPGIFQALFPCASITGAPKIKTMEIIQALESGPRGLYTGSIGFITPQGDAQFNVAIRTAVIEKRARQLVYPVGSGIVWDSQADREYSECLLKAKAIKTRAPVFRLIETLLWEPDADFFLLDDHLKRMSVSAGYFDFNFEAASARELLYNLGSQVLVRQNRIAKVRLLASRRGELNIEHSLLKPLSFWRVRLAAERVDSRDIFLYHKTTNRTVYETALKKAGSQYDDVILFNERNEITESCWGNVVVRLSGVNYTPPVACGLLNGVFRQHLLKEGKVTEGIISTFELEKAEEVFIINSVRRFVSARFV